MRTSEKKKIYLITLAVIISIITLGGYIHDYVIGPDYDKNFIAQPKQTKQSAAIDKKDQPLKLAFEIAINHMQRREYKKALKAWHDVLKLQPELPEAHVNMGFSLYELNEYEAAKKFFISAIELNKYQANAYYGLAICLEKQDDLEAAIGAMRSYIHLASKSNFIKKARSAIWEWESSLKKSNRLSGAPRKTNEGSGKDDPLK